MTPRLTWLYCPASRPDRVAKALRSKADAVILDLEDGVAPSERTAAREHLKRALADYVSSAGSPYIQVRVNGVGTQDFAADIDVVASLTAVASVRVPKVESLEDIDVVAAALDERTPIHALIENARGVERLGEICHAPRVAGVSLGEADLRAELRLSGDATITAIRSTLVIACAAASIDAPMGSAYTNVHDHEGLTADTRALAAEGFVGRTALHPSQLAHIRAAFAPSEEDYQRALEIAEAAGSDASGDRSGAAALPDGTFIDRPVIARALQTIAMRHAVTQGDTV